MSYLPPQSLNDAWALLAVISDPEKAKKALEELRIERDQSMKALDNARSAQTAANRMREETTKLIADLNKREAELRAEVEKKIKDVDAKAKVLNDRESALTATNNELSAWSKSLDREKMNLDQREKAYEARLKTLNEMDRSVCDREARVKAILDELGPLAQKLQGK